MYPGDAMRTKVREETAYRYRRGLVEALSQCSFAYPFVSPIAYAVKATTANIINPYTNNIITLCHFYLLPELPARIGVALWADIGQRAPVWTFVPILTQAVTGPALVSF